jgi:hypothetical protein
MARPFSTAGDASQLDELEEGLERELRKADEGKTNV